MDFMPPPLDTAGTTLVVGHSHDPSSDDALAVALDLGRRLRAQLHVVHVIGTGDYPIDIDAGDWEERGRQALAEQRRRVERVLVGSRLRWTYETRRGDPAVELARAAEEHDALLIVVGTRGEGMRMALPRLIEPSVSHGVIHLQHRPVVVVPVPETDTHPDAGHSRPHPAKP
jgi:nucleotide-binding universal stress UspA family protein